MGHLLDYQSHDKAARSLTLTGTCSEGKIPSENSTCDTQRMTTFSAPSLFAALRERSSYSLHFPPMACHWREPALKPWQNRGPGRIQVQVQQRHNDQKHQPDHTSISHLLHLLPLTCHAATGAASLLRTIDIQPDLDRLPSRHHHISTGRRDDDRLPARRHPEPLTEINSNDQLITLDFKLDILHRLP